jgi:pilus assembly protein FimV
MFMRSLFRVEAPGRVRGVRDVHRIILFLVLLTLGMPAGANISLGDIDVRSFLNQPLQAQISVQGTALADDRLEFRLASEEAYRRAGLTRSAVPSDLDIRLEGTGTSRIVRLTTQRPVREPYVGLLLEASWGAGRVLREYTILLDPPLAFPRERSVAPTISRAAEPAPAPATRPAPVARPEPAVRAGTYTVRRGDSLFNIVRQQGYAGVTPEQAMLAILEANPQAFIGSNVNQLRAGAQLTLPSEQEVAARSPDAARQEIRRQTAEWRDRTAPRPPPAPKPAAVSTPAPEPAPETRPPQETISEPEPAPIPDQPEPAPTTPEEPEPAVTSQALEDVAAAPVMDPGAVPADPEPAVMDRLEILSEAEAEADAGGVTAASTRIIEEALLSQQVAMSELREELVALRTELAERDRVISVVSTELAQMEQRMRDLQARSGSGFLRGDSGEGMALHERILADPLLLLLAATTALLFLLLLVALFRPVRRQPATPEPVPAGLPPVTPVAPSAARTTDDSREREPAWPRGTGSAPSTGPGAWGGAALAAGAAVADVTASRGRDQGPASAGDIQVGESLDGDVLADVDLYLAYGMHEQAIAALEAAIDGGRDDPEHRVRLIEAYAAKDAGEEVRVHAAALRERLGPDDGALRERIAAAEARFAPPGINPGSVAARTGGPQGAGSVPAANSLEFEAFDLPDVASAHEAADAGPRDERTDANLLQFDLEGLDTPASPGPDSAPQGGGEGAGIEWEEVTLGRLPESDDDTAPRAFGSTDADTSEQGLKLSLAEAFAEMGDRDGALALLEEIASTATADQAARIELVRRQIEGGKD